MDQVSVLVLVPIVSLAGGWLGAYFGAYFREKGKNLATREDIDRLTHTTEEIKAQIGGDLWVQQRSWEFKVDAYKRLLEHLNDAASFLRQLEIIETMQQRRKAKVDSLDTELEAAERDYDARADQALNGIRTAGVFAPVFVGEVARAALQALVSEWVQAQQEERDYYKFAKRLRKTLIETSKILETAAREDLKLGTTTERR